jgi:hypothetical protein
VLKEETVEEVASDNLIGIDGLAVDVAAGGGGLDHRALHIGVVEGIDVDGEALSVLGELLRAADGPETETAGVVVAHGTLVGGIVVVDETHALNGVAGLVELAEDGDEVGGNGAMADELSAMGTALTVDMGHGEVAEVAERNRARGRIALALHALVHGGGDGIDTKSLRKGGKRKDEKKEDEKKGHDLESIQVRVMVCTSMGS